MADIKIGDRVIMNNKYLVSEKDKGKTWTCLLYTSPSPRD